MACMRCGGVLTSSTSRRTTFVVYARNSSGRQDWRFNGPALDGGGRGRSGRGPARGRGSRPARLFKDTDDDESPSRSHSFHRENLPRRVYDNLVPRRTIASAPRLPSSRPVSRPPTPSYVTQDPFANMHRWIQMQHVEGVVVRRETWEKMFGHIGSGSEVHQALELMLRDAAVRDGGEWDWSTHGYGQIAFQLVQVAAAVGAPEVAERLLERRKDLHLTLNKDLVPTLIRKVAAATSDPGSASSSDNHLDVIQRLYEQEAVLCGANTPEAAYELSRVLRRLDDVGGVQALHSQMVKEGLAMRAGLLEDLASWLARRGVRV